MKNVLLIMLSQFLVTACGNGGQKKAQGTSAETQTETKVAE